MVEASGGPATKDPQSADPVTPDTHGQSFYALALGAIGVVFGDIGTSPLYAMREALHHNIADLDELVT